MLDLVPDQGLNSGPLHWEPGVLVTGPPGKSQETRVFHVSLQGGWV